MRLQAANVAESPTLKAAVDTYAAETQTGDAFVQRAAARTRSPRSSPRSPIASKPTRIVIVDTAQHTLAAVGPDGARRGRRDMPFRSSTDPRPWSPTDSVAHIGDATFRVVTVPLMRQRRLDASDRCISRPASIGTSHSSSASWPAREIAIVDDGQLVASTMIAGQRGRVRRRGADAGRRPARSSSHGESNAYRRLFDVGDTAFYALTSIDGAARAAIGDTTSSAAAHRDWRDGVSRCSASIWIAHRLSEPIERLSSSLHRMATSRDVRREAAIDRIEPRARHAHRNVQRADGVGRLGGSRDRSRLHRSHPRAGGRARRARSVYRRSLRARQRAVGRHRPRR